MNEKDVSKFFLLLVLVFISLLCCINSGSIRSIYIGHCSDLKRITKALEKYDANAVVIDVKDDFGILFPDLPISQNSKNKFISNNKLKNVLIKLKNKGIYTIARIVALKEFVRQDLCIKDENGNVMIDKEKTSWMDPRNEEVIKYLEEICVSAIKIGFDEIQLDYVRFSPYFTKIDSSNNVRIDAINNFIDKICNSIHKVGGKVSVCVFGCVIDKSVDTDNNKDQAKKSSKILGQDYIEIAKRADFICPMIYPSHYPLNTPCGIKYPDLEPYNTISKCLELSNNTLKNRSNIKAVVRPYLQAFTASWLKYHIRYGKKEIQEQINAIYDKGLNQWSLFNMAVKYPD
ncbi:MAG: hypothetical protein IJ730_06510 [Alphaproteobacteria bacterium]|nr:hypothetical protein [Alphaproteobacteria bacterium]